METPTTATVTAILRQHGATLGLAVERVEVTPIGQGEANLNVLATVNQTHRFNLRIGLRGAESARTLQSEFDLLQLVPKGIGPTAFVVDCSQTQLGYPFMLLEYLAGEVKKTWDTPDLQAHARTLARLHERQFAGHGPIGQLSQAPYDFLHRFAVALDYWQVHHPYLFDIPIVQRLLPPIRHFVSEHASLFTRLRRFSLVHGDAHPLNVLFHADTVRYIDWEMAAIGDPALDLAMIGWGISTPWQMALTAEQIDNFLATYCALKTDEDLCQRRAVWIVYTMYFDQLYHRTQIAHDATGKQAYTVQQIETYLAQRFL